MTGYRDGDQNRGAEAREGQTQSLSGVWQFEGSRGGVKQHLRTITSHKPGRNCDRFGRKSTSNEDSFVSQILIGVAALFALIDACLQKKHFKVKNVKMHVPIPLGKDKEGKKPKEGEKPGEAGEGRAAVPPQPPSPAKGSPAKGGKK